MHSLRLTIFVKEVNWKNLKIEFIDNLFPSVPFNNKNLALAPEN